uniref:LAGLIDADG endonuclease n=1 Tax=Ramaria rubella TaxID=113071 RepID=UPI0022373625|nr:LAGLIDADG endonuclease [Ramaria rubella]UYR22219.1 LAGLIDADG endonuclease [Ramaria rubella]
MVGFLLGDGSLIKKYEGGGTYFQYTQSINHSEYLHFIFNLFKELGLIKKNEPYLGVSVVKGKTYNYYSFSTRSLKIWNNLYHIWYKSKVKVIPDNLLNILSPISLAYWLMDDGGWTNNGIHLNSNFFFCSRGKILNRNFIN